MNRRRFLGFLPMIIPGLGLATLETKTKSLPVGVPSMICKECLSMMDTSFNNEHGGKATSCPNPRCKNHGIVVEVIWLESKVVG